MGKFEGPGFSFGQRVLQGARGEALKLRLVYRGIGAYGNELLFM
jgi:hypothetical protein